MAVQQVEPGSALFSTKLEVNMKKILLKLVSEMNNWNTMNRVDSCINQSHLCLVSWTPSNKIILVWGR